MSESKIEVDGRAIESKVVELLLKNIPLTVKGYKCTSIMIFRVLVYASIMNLTIETVCQTLKGLVSGETVRSHLNNNLTEDGLDELENQINEILGGYLSRSLRRAKLTLGIDYHDEPYWGENESLLSYTCRGQAKQGTTHFFRVATLYVIHHGQRFTIACRFVYPGDTPAQVVSDLLYRICQLGISVRRVYLDRGFCGVEVHRLFEASRIPAIIACPIRGKSDGNGTRALCRGRKSYRTTHTFYPNSKQKACQVNIAVVRSYTKRKKKRYKATWLLFVTHHCQAKPLTIRRWYRQRFGIETSYRLMRTVRAITKSPNVALRFFLIALAFIIVNCWVYCQKRYADCFFHPQHRHTFIRKFQLSLFCSLLKTTIEQFFPPRLSFVFLL